MTLKTVLADDTIDSLPERRSLMTIKEKVQSRLPIFGLSIYESRDLEEFTFVKDIVNREEDDAARVGFQYPAFFVHGDTLYLAIRSAFNNADNFHNSNHILFYKTEF